MTHQTQSQGLERHRTQGELFSTFASWLVHSIVRLDRPPPPARGQVDRRLFLEDAGYMDCGSQAIPCDRMIPAMVSVQFIVELSDHPGS